jgi:hypothetical protein
MCIITGGGLTNIAKVLRDREIQGYKFGPAGSCPISGGNILSLTTRLRSTPYKCELTREWVQILMVLNQVRLSAHH